MNLYNLCLAYSRNVKQFIQQHRSSSLHKNIVKNFKRRQWVIPAMLHTISCDLIGKILDNITWKIFFNRLSKVWKSQSRIQLYFVYY